MTKYFKMEYLYQSKPRWLYELLEDQKTECAACKKQFEDPKMLFMMCKNRIHPNYKRNEKGRRLGKEHYSEDEIKRLVNMFEARCMPCVRIRAYLWRFRCRPFIEPEQCQGPLCDEKNTCDDIDLFCEKCKEACDNLWGQVTKLKLNMGPCSACSKKMTPENEFLFDFDHIDPWHKRYSICFMVRRLFSMEEIQHEIKKCQPTCVECHRERTITQKHIFSQPEFKYYRRRVHDTPRGEPMPDLKEVLDHYSFIMNIARAPVQKTKYNENQPDTSKHHEEKRIKK